MYRVRWMVAIALALLCAGGVAMSQSEPTTPPMRHILAVGFSADPGELVAPGEVTLTFTITNTSDYDAQNVYISSADGLHTEPLGQIDAGENRVFSRSHSVTEEELEAGVISYTLSHDGIAGDTDTVNYSVQCPIERAIARAAVEFTRQFTSTCARLGETVTIAYRVRNTGNVQITSVRIDDELGEYAGRAETLEVGQTRLFTSKVTIGEDAVSAPRLTYQVPAEGGREYEATLEAQAIRVADEQLTVSLALDREVAAVGESVTATLTIASMGNVDFYDISVYDEAYGGLIADALEMPAGSHSLVVTHEYPVREDMTLQLRVRALSASGSTIEALTEPVDLSVQAADAQAQIALRAEAVYPRVASAGEVPVDVEIVNMGGADASEATLLETTTDTTVRTFALLAGNYATRRRVYVNVEEDAQLVFALHYLDAQGARRVAVSQPVSIEIARDGAVLSSAGESVPFSGESVKINQSSTFLFLMLGAGAVLIALVVALLLTTRRQRRTRRERLAQLRRLRQEELGKTNRFTPVKRQERDKKKKDGAS